MKTLKNLLKQISCTLTLFLLTVLVCYADGKQGINAASSSLKAYVDPLGDLILIIGGVVGIIGGVRVFIKWNSGDQDINKELMSWGGSCIFLVLVSVVIKGFFGV